MQLSKYFLYAVVFLSVSFTIFFVLISVLSEQVKLLEDYRTHMWAMSYEEVASEKNLEKDISFAFQALEQHRDLPLILTDTSHRIISVQNFEDLELGDPVLEDILEEIRSYQDPVKIFFSGEVKFLVYHQRSKIFSPHSIYTCGGLSVEFFASYFIIYTMVCTVSSQSKFTVE